MSEYVEEIEDYGLTSEQLAQFERAKADIEAEIEDREIESGPLLVDMADVDRVEVKWLWPGHIPQGRLTFIAGKPGEGKTFVVTDLTARVTRGLPWPDGQPNEHCGSVLLIVAEDALDDTLGPRMDAAGVDSSRGKVVVLKAVRRTIAGKRIEQMFSLRDVDDLKAALSRMTECKLIVIDPIGSFLGSHVDAHRDNEVRAVLAPLAQIAEDAGVAVVIIAHTRKAVSTAADDGILGSRAFTGLARAVWHLSHDKCDRDRKLFLPGKCNLAKQPKGLAFKIDGDPPRITWDDTPLQMHADDALAEDDKPGPEPEARRAAEEWLANLLKDGPVPSGDIDNPEPGSVRGEAKAADFKWATIRRAAEHLGVRKEKNVYSKVYEWRLPKAGKVVAQSGCSSVTKREQPEQPEQPA